jgi:4'-phosphopantetheinyl transferase
MSDNLLSATVAHLWQIDVDRGLIANAIDLLDPDERSRADRFFFPPDRARYLAAHIALRQILSRYLEIDPAHIHFRSNEYGKPFVIDQAIEFSLSHSGDVILIAVTRDQRIGVDVEHIRSDFDYQPIVDRFFAADEKSLLFSLPQSIQAQQFFKMWTRKEAVLKMLGQGLSNLDQMEVALDQWSVQEVEVGADYAAALAVANDSVTIKNFQM